MTVRTFFKRGVFLCLFMVLSACASVEGGDPRDPWEGWNRGVFSFNKAADRYAISPFVRGYRAVLPAPVRQGITNAVLNLREPGTFSNELLQAKFDDAGLTLARFLINSTLGVAGIFNVASEFGLSRTFEDYGQTLGVWGIGDGPYMVLPFLGPSNVRDSTGLAIAIFADPTQIGLDKIDLMGLQLANNGINALDTRARLQPTIDSLYEEADPYVFARSAYIQQRRFAVCDGRCPGDADEEEDLFDDLEDELEEETDPPLARKPQ